MTTQQPILSIDAKVLTEVADAIEKIAPAVVILNPAQLVTDADRLELAFKAGRASVVTDLRAIAAKPKKG